MANHQKEARNVNEMDAAVIAKRLKRMLDFRNEYLQDVENVHLHLQKGNDKTGEDCWTVSLIPIADCVNCSGCKGKCYDIRNDCWRPFVQKDRARNSAIRLADPERFWSEEDMQIKVNNVKQLRVNVGGDLRDEDFSLVSQLAKRNRGTLILFFTKNYDGINAFLKERSFPDNVKPIISRWPDMPCDNPFNLPVSHVLWADGSTTAPEYGAVYCGGNCSECVIKGEGCWTLPKGGHVIFRAH